MADVQTNKTQEAKWTPKWAPTTVKRNDVEAVFEPNQVSRGKEKGWEYLASKVDESNLDSIIAWMGRNIAAKKLGAFLKQMAQGWWGDAEEEATDKTNGQVDHDKLYEVFNKLATDFSARGESIPDLKNQIDDLVVQLSDLDPTQDDFAIQAKDLAIQIKELQLAISLKRRKTDEEKAAEAATSTK